MKRRDIQPIYQKAQKRKRRLKRLLVSLFILGLGTVIIGLTLNNRAQQWAKYPVRGVMIDQNDGYIDFLALKAKRMRFVYLKATQGAIYTDDHFNDNYQRSQGAQIPIGVYHTFSFSSSNQDQFKNLIKTVGTNSGSLPIVVEVDYYGEYTKDSLDKNKVRQQLNQFVKQIHNYYHHPVGIAAPKELMQQLAIKPTTKQPVWQTDGDFKEITPAVTFMEVDSDAKFKIGGVKVGLRESVFNGDNKKWVHYLGTQINVNH